MSNVANRIASLSPEKLGLLMKRLGGDKAPAARATLPRIERTTNQFPLSFTQQRQWFMEQLAPGTVYNVPQALRLTGQLDVTAMERALNLMVQRHETLRTTFPVIAGQPAQVLHPAQPVTLPVIDLRELPEETRAAETNRLITQAAQHHFDLATGPLWQVLLLRLAAEVHVLIISMHHIIADGWSIGVAMRELAAVYAGLVSGNSVTLPELPIQYVDFAAWQRAWLEETSSAVDTPLQRQLTFWQQQLAGVPALLRLPTDRPRPPVQTFNGATVPVTLTPAQTAALRTLSDRAGVTLFMTMLTAFKALLSHYTGQDDICVGTPIANRTRTELEGLIGLFINTLVLRTDLSGNPRLPELLDRVRRVALDAYAHQDLPLEKLVEALQPERDLSYSPLFQVLFVLAEGSAANAQIPGLAVEVLPSHSGTAQFDLSLYLSETPQAIQGFIEYNTDLFDTETITEFVYHYQSLLERMAAQPEADLTTLLADIPPQQLSLVVTSAFTAEPLEDSLAFWMEELHIPARIRFSPYSQVFQQLLDPTSLLATNHEGINIILLRLEDWAQKYAGPDAERFQVLAQHVTDFLEALTVLRAQTVAPCIVCLCPPSPAMTGNPERVAWLERLEQRLAGQLAALPNVTLLHYRELLRHYPVATVNDPLGDELGHLPYTPEFFAILGTYIARAILGQQDLPYQAMLLDGDDTLWSGRLPLPAGEQISPPYQALQTALVARQRTGMRLAICSQHADADLLAVLNNQSLILRQEHLAAWQSGPEPLASRINALAARLQLPLSACVYISGNAEVCAEARATCPELLTLQLPAEPERIADFLEHTWVLPVAKGGR